MSSRDKAWKLTSIKKDYWQRQTKRRHKFTDKDYAAYLKSPEWKERRRRFHDYLISKGNYFCYRCGSPGSFRFPVHHLHYRNVFDEKFSDLRLICIDCHSEVHPRLAKTNPPRPAGPFDEVFDEFIEATR